MISSNLITSIDFRSLSFPYCQGFHFKGRELQPQFNFLHAKFIGTAIRNCLFIASTTVTTKFCCCRLGFDFLLKFHILELERYEFSCMISSLRKFVLNHMLLMFSMVRYNLFKRNAICCYLQLVNTIFSIERYVGYGFKMQIVYLHVVVPCLCLTYGSHWIILLRLFQYQILLLSCEKRFLSLKRINCKKQGEDHTD